MALEGGDDGMGVRPECAIDRKRIAIHGEHRLQRFDRLALLTLREIAPVDDRLRRDEMPDTRFMQARPGKQLARILLAQRRHVGMGQHVLRWNAPARADVAGQRDYRVDLRLGEGRQPAIMAGIGDLDADRAGIDIRGRLPGGFPRMRRPPAALGDKPGAPAIPEERSNGAETLRDLGLATSRLQRPAAIRGMPV